MKGANGRNGHGNGNGHTKPGGELTRMAEIVELRTAERDAALVFLDQLEAILKHDGGYRLPEDQAKIRGARAFLVSHGRRSPDESAPWKNRTSR